MTIGGLTGGYGSFGYMNTAMNTGTPGSTASASGTQDVNKASSTPDEVKKLGRRSSPAECETCKSRKYQDGSDESNVSFKAAAHVSPESAGAAVRAHEGQHVSNAYKKAAQKNGEVVNASVSIHTAVCPECGRTYVSGGTTNTTIKYSNERNKQALDAMMLTGANVDYAS